MVQTLTMFKQLCVHSFKCVWPVPYVPYLLHRIKTHSSPKATKQAMGRKLYVEVVKVTDYPFDFLSLQAWKLSRMEMPNFTTHQPLDRAHIHQLKGHFGKN